MKLAKSIAVYEQLRRMIPDIPGNARKLTLVLEQGQAAKVVVEYFADINDEQPVEKQYLLHEIKPHGNEPPSRRIHAESGTADPGRVAIGAGERDEGNPRQDPSRYPSGKKADTSSREVQDHVGRNG